MSRTFLITGAASGIGAATARRLAGPDIRFLLHTRKSAEGLEGVANDLKDAGARVETALADLSEPGAAAGLIGRAVDVFGGLDGVVANAGFAQAGHFGEVDRAALDASMTAMTGAFFDLATAAMEPLKQSGAGRIVAVSSFVAHVFDGDRPFAVTAAAKAGMEALVKALARQLAADGVTVNAVAPGYTQKDATGHSALNPETWERAAKRTPTGRLAQPDDVAALIEFLMSAQARQITGQVIHVDGGLTLGK